MVQPRLLIIVRHAQSEGNKNREIHQTIPDHRVKLTQEGWQQARDAGRRLRAMLRPDDTLHFFTSPYRRTRETTDGILQTLTSDEENGPSPFQRSDIKVYEEPRLREQDFGNFQPCSAEMERMWQERADYGHFFYRIPNGESAADAYDRISGFNESLWRQFGEDDFASVCVLVTHGLMSRVFLMKWYHFTVEYFEDLRNVNHCEFLIMRKQEDSGRYVLENKLRTWSALHRERARERGEADEKGKDGRDAFKLERTKTFVSARRWGGCPNGCNHSSHYKRRDDLDLMRMRDESGSNGNAHANGDGSTHAASSGSSTIISRRSTKRIQTYNSDDDPNDPLGEHDDQPDDDRDVRHERIDRNPQIDVLKSRADGASSSDGSPCCIQADDRLPSLSASHLHVGRDFGGTYSGHASMANSEDESDDDRHKGKRRQRHGTPLTLRVKGTKASAGDDGEKPQDCVDDDNLSCRARANRLGDAPHSSSDVGSDGDHEGEGEGVGDGQAADLDKVEKEEKSMEGSVY